eukprot:TRINITY_DN3401_c0_g3_i1.p1 TRINITY_DN3401_c0_g3~~TRINITY_DN3401_c0_g3_i1.p1  ORF type:complete len:365 (+),score=58.85 TRINITY_DN3401_c0_g3_i1:1293-2387(+)
MDKMYYVTILGAGIMGLSSALKIHETATSNRMNVRISILSSKFGCETTSGGAPGLWTPFAAKPIDKIERWSIETKDEIKKLFASEPLRCPVSFAYAESIHHHNPGSSPELVDDALVHILDDYKKLDGSQKRGKIEEGRLSYTYTAPIIQTTKYLDYLTSKLINRGINIEKYEIKSIEDVFDKYPQTNVLINTLGLGSSTILRSNNKQDSLYPIRGILVRIPAQSQFMNKAISADNYPGGMAYVISRPDCCVLGGTYEENNTNDRASDEEVSALVKRCVDIVPQLGSVEKVMSEIKEVWVGFRPGRKDGVRLEMDQIQILHQNKAHKLPLIHCYGHGGSGWTTHWGCANEVSQLCLDAIRSPSKL